jgi:hypothetical protein
LTIIDSKITSYHGAVASYGEGAVVTLNDSEIDMAGIPGFTSHGIYTYENGKVIVDGGTYANKATDQAASGASVINGAVEVKAGNFSGRIENYYGTPVLKGGSYSVEPKKAFIAAGYKAVKTAAGYTVILEGKTYVSSNISDPAGVTYEGDVFENPINDALYFNNYIFEGDASINVTRTYGAIVLENCKADINGDLITIDNDNNSVMVLQNLDLTLADGKKLIKSTNTIYQVFMSNITINGVKVTTDTVAQYLENVAWYQVVEEI